MNTSESTDRFSVQPVKSGSQNDEIFDDITTAKNETVDTFEAEPEAKTTRFKKVTILPQFFTPLETGFSSAPYIAII